MKTLSPRRDGLFFLSVVLILLFLSSCGSPGADRKDLLFFYLETCPSCEDYQLAEELSRKIALLNKGREWRAEAYNLADVENKNILLETLAEKELPDVSRSLPILIIDREYINGYGSIQNKMEELSP